MSFDGWRQLYASTAKSAGRWLVSYMTLANDAGHRRTNLGTLACVEAKYALRGVA